MLNHQHLIGIVSHWNFYGDADKAIYQQCYDKENKMFAYESQLYFLAKLNHKKKWVSYALFTYVKLQMNYA